MCLKKRLRTRQLKREYRLISLYVLGLLHVNPQLTKKSFQSTLLDSEKKDTVSISA